MGMVLGFQGTVWGDISIDDFSTNRTYSTCCGEFGVYDSFESNVFQFGTNGTVLIGGTATDNGGLYRDQLGVTLWNFTAQTNLLVRARALPGNQATNFIVMFRDSNLKCLLFYFPFSELNTNSFTTLSAPLATPGWTDGTPFDFSHVVSWDIYGAFSENDSPIRFEIDSMKVEGPTLTGALQMRYEVINSVLILAWPTNLAGGFVLQSTATLPGLWTNETTITIVGGEYRFSQPLTNESRFYRLLATEEDPGDFSSMSEVDYISVVAPTKPETERLQMPTSERPLQTGGGPPLPPGLGSRLMMADGLTPPPAATNAPLTTESYIDVGSYSGSSASTMFMQVFQIGIGDFESDYALNFSDHTGGYDRLHTVQYDSHIASTNSPYPWLRTTNAIYTNSYQTAWTPSDANWPSGLRSEISGQAQTNYYVGRPLVPFAHIGGVTNTYFEGNTNSQGSPSSGMIHTESRRDDTQLDLHVGRHLSNYWYKFVLLSAAADRVDRLGYARLPNDPEADGSLAPAVQHTALSFSNVTVLGQPLNADDRVFLQMRAATVENATPAVTGAADYLFNVAIASHMLVNMTMLYHPIFELPPFSPPPTYIPKPQLTNLQAAFNSGSLVLGRDDDTRISDSDPSAAFSTNATSLYRSDDVPCYVEFLIANGPSTTNRHTRRLSTVFPAPFQDRKYYHVRSDDLANALLNSGIANVKIVRSLYYGGQPVGGLANRGVKPATILLPHDYTSSACIHEWGHSCGIAHRGEPVNPGPADGTALMTKTNVASQVKINRYERDLMDNYNN